MSEMFRAMARSIRIEFEGALYRIIAQGSREFAERMLEIGECVLKKPRHAGDRSAQEIRVHGEQEVQRLISEGLAAGGLGEADLQKRPGSDPIKSVLAEIIWSRT